MAEDLKNSATVWGGKVEDAPPAYSGDLMGDDSSQDQDSTPQQAIQTTSRRPIQRIPYDPLRRLAPLSAVSFHKYNIPDGIVSPDKISLTVRHSDLYAHPQHLLPFILEQAHLPPKPTLRIVGTHYGERVDFDITINLTHLLDLRNLKWSFNSAQVSPIQGGSQATYVRDDPSVPARVADLTKQFCQDRSENKSFYLRRKVQGLPTENLAGQVRNLAASVKYRGLIRIDFTDERSQVIVHKQPSSWFSNMLRLHPEKKYDMLEVVWRLSDGTEGGAGDIGETGLRAGHEWWQSWSDTIRNAIISKKKGTVGIDDWIETKMGRHEPEPRMDWGPDQFSA